MIWPWQYGLKILEEIKLIFEGSEKKVEVLVEKGSLSLRELGASFWEKIVFECEASILSTLSNEFCDAYLLSESSLFVWEDRFTMITCGNTVLVNSVVKFSESIEKDLIKSIIFQRKNEYFGELQKTSFSKDLEKLKNITDGVAMRFGHLDDHHNYLFHINKEMKPNPEDITTELLMYHIQGKAGEVFRNKKQSLDEIRNLMGLDSLFPGFKFDDHLFEPFGYSLNGLKDDCYLTIHVTPQEESSYVSFETNCDIKKDHPEILDKLLLIFNPESFDIVSFNTLHEMKLGTHNASCISKYHQKLSCGYDVYFNEYTKRRNKVFGATILDPTIRNTGHCR